MRRSSRRIVFALFFRVSQGVPVRRGGRCFSGEVPVEVVLGTSEGEGGSCSSCCVVCMGVVHLLYRCCCLYVGLLVSGVDRVLLRVGRLLFSVDRDLALEGDLELELEL